MGEQFNFTVGGQGFSISRDEIERKLKGVRPEQIRQYYVTVNGKDYPVKQALEISAGLLRSGFTTQDAIRVLRKFGLPLRKNCE
ncbi:MAG TPA: hypothetical protein VJY15_01830 [Candidatus Acidoferrum sp.]|nr:hypothetical protein [Candidatus Acidoferrum sp.]